MSTGQGSEDLPPHTADPNCCRPLITSARILFLPPDIRPRQATLTGPSSVSVLLLVSLAAGFHAYVIGLIELTYLCVTQVIPPPFVSAQVIAVGMASTTVNVCRRVRFAACVLTLYRSCGTPLSLAAFSMASRIVGHYKRRMTPMSSRTRSTSAST